MQSTVQGHRHTEMFTEFAVGANFKVFGCAVGCGIDNTSYAMAYGKNFKNQLLVVQLCLEGITQLTSQCIYSIKSIFSDQSSGMSASILWIYISRACCVS